MRARDGALANTIVEPLRPQPGPCTIRAALRDADTLVAEGFAPPFRAYVSSLSLQPAFGDYVPACRCWRPGERTAAPLWNGTTTYGLQALIWKGFQPRGAFGIV